MRKNLHNYKEALAENRDWDTKARKDLATGKIKGAFAGPHRSYPISSAADVTNAWNLAGHADNPDEVRRNIKRIAKQHGWESGLPKTAREKYADTPEPVTVDVPVAILGSWEHPQYGETTFTEQDFSEMQENFEQNTIGYEPPLYIGHDRSQPACGYLTRLYREDDVLWGTFELLSEEKYEDLDGYRYSSPEITRETASKTDGSNIGTVLTGLALTNHPFLTGMPRVSLSAGGQQCSTAKYFFMCLDNPDIAYDVLLNERRTYGKQVVWNEEGNVLLYVTADDNPVADQGFMCSSCAFYTQAGYCELIGLKPPNPVEPGGYCKLWFPVRDEENAEVPEEEAEDINSMVTMLNDFCYAEQGYEALVKYIEEDNSEE